MSEKKDYTFAVARIRAKENTLLSDNDISMLMSTKNYEECISLLTDKGWNADNISDYEEILQQQENQLWELLRELVDDLSDFEIFTCQKDFFNLKSAVKAVISNSSTDGIFLKSGNISPETIYNAVKNKEYNLMPSYLSTCAEEAVKALLQTRDGQLCDIIIDNALLEYINKLALNSKSDITKLYADTFVAVANIKIAVRCCKTGKQADFINKAISECNTLNKDMLVKATLMGFDEICNYLLTTDYRGAVEPLKKSFSAFEVWSDNKLTESLKPQKWEPFSIGALIAYIFAKENEIKTVRIIISAKVNSLDNELIEERLRKMYV